MVLALSEMKPPRSQRNEVFSMFRPFLSLTTCAYMSDFNTLVSDLSLQICSSQTRVHPDVFPDDHPELVFNRMPTGERLNSTLTTMEEMGLAKRSVIRVDPRSLNTNILDQLDAIWKSFFVAGGGDFYLVSFNTIPHVTIPNDGNGDHHLRSLHANLPWSLAGFGYKAEDVVLKTSSYTQINDFAFNTFSAGFSRPHTRHPTLPASPKICLLYFCVYPKFSAIFGTTLTMGRMQILFTELKLLALSQSIALWPSR